MWTLQTLVGVSSLDELVINSAVSSGIVHAEPERRDECVLVVGNEVAELLNGGEDGGRSEVGELSGWSDGRLKHEQSVWWEVNSVFKIKVFLVYTTYLGVWNLFCFKSNFFEYVSVIFANFYNISIYFHIMTEGLRGGMNDIFEDKDDIFYDILDDNINSATYSRVDH